MTDTPATPPAAARGLHLAVLHEGGRVRAAEGGAEDGPVLRRPVELGLPVAQLVDGSYSAVDPRAVGERIGGDLPAACSDAPTAGFARRSTQVGRLLARGLTQRASGLPDGA
ncbi:hypothetical protein [Kitasatospora sp. NPDC054795]